jgi:hypothetical protein
MSGFSLVDGDILNEISIPIWSLYKIGGGSHIPSVQTLHKQVFKRACLGWRKKETSSFPKDRSFELNIFNEICWAATTGMLSVGFVKSASCMEYQLVVKFHSEQPQIIEFGWKKVPKCDIISDTIFIENPKPGSPFIVTTFSPSLPAKTTANLEFGVPPYERGLISEEERRVLGFCFSICRASGIKGSYAYIDKNKMLHWMGISTFDPGLGDEIVVDMAIQKHMIVIATLNRYIKIDTERSYYASLPGKISHISMHGLYFVSIARDELGNFWIQLDDFYSKPAPLRYAYNRVKTDSYESAVSALLHEEDVLLPSALKIDRIKEEGVNSSECLLAYMLKEECQWKQRRKKVALFHDEIHYISSTNQLEVVQV